MWKTTLKAIIVSFLLITNLYASSVAEIAGLQLPLIEGAVAIKSSAESAAGQAKILSYSVNKPVEEVVAFYQAFLQENNFITIGNGAIGGLDVAVKKDTAMFSLKIFAQAGKTVVQFIW